MRRWLLLVAVVLLFSFTAASLLGQVPWQQAPCAAVALETHVEVNGAPLEAPFTSESAGITVNANSLVSIIAEFKPEPPGCMGDYNIDWEFNFASDPYSVELFDQPGGETAEIKVGNRAAKDVVVLSLRSSSGSLQRRDLSLNVQEE